MKEKIADIRGQIEADAGQLNSPEAVEAFRIRYLGKKGAVTLLFKELGSVDKADRPEVGKLINELRALTTEKMNGAAAQAGPIRSKDWIDLTLNGRRPAIGRKHPLTIVAEEFRQIFARLGFSVAEGPEVESDYLNFEALNIPKLHPARDMQDTLYISDELVLRTHTSPVQIRTMMTGNPPFRVIAPGRVYRRDTLDASHSPCFHQVEGLCVDKGVSLGDLKAVLSTFSKQMFGANTKVRFRPSFFPFTEPSAEMDIWWESSKGGRWLELLGCGMVNPRVLEGVDVDPAVYSGYAFGLGIDRMAMLKFGIDDIRTLFENDMRFLEQF